MGRESSMKPDYQILAYITHEEGRVLASSSSLVLKAKDEEEKKTLTVDIAKAMKADVTQLSNGDYMVIRV